MKFKTLLFLSGIILFIGCNNKNETLPLPSSWIGSIKMGDATPELVFYLYQDSIEKPTGHLGIPIKGIEKIPLSNTLISGDSIRLSISAASASYDGIIAKDKKTISGIWKEGDNEFLLILEPLVKEIDYSTTQKVNMSSLNLEHTSTNFNFYSEKSDMEILENLSSILEKNFLRMTSKMNTSFDAKIDVFIYPDIEDFHKAINYPEAPDWVVGAANKNELKMVSPLNPGKAHTYESLMDAIVHELVHTIVLNLRSNGLIGLPNWLNEGYAYYEAGQFNQEDEKLIQSKLQNNEIPSWEELKNANTSQFGDMGGYGISTSIIDFLIETYGSEKFKQFIIDPENAEVIYNMSEAKLEQKWLDYIEKYNF